MMHRPSAPELLKPGQSYYSLVVAVAKRIAADGASAVVVAIAERHGVPVPHLNTVLVTLRMRARLEGQS